MRSGPAVIAALLLALALIPPGCGEEQTKAADRGANDQLAAARQCRGSLGDLLDSMESLNNSLAVGLSYDNYLSAVNHVRATYAPIRANRLQLACLVQVANPAEQALNSYIEAANTWGNCLSTTSCNPESIEPKLQRKWTEAAGSVARARSGLRGSID
jgi:hypothetical protein